ncbi:UTRA domain-containing protein [Longispora sp. NPDC051575]|uniref:UTRA domain-containing protein n=1 Tax=Longispora sp. NPDC051575 TaxID=3154943 RepID=UPI00343386B7
MTTVEQPIRRLARNRAQAGEQRGFYADLVQAGVEWNVTTTIDPAKPAPAAVAELLGVTEATPVLARARRMATTDAPLQLATSWFSPAIVEQLPILAEDNTGPGGMYSRFEDAGYTLEHTDIVGAREASQEEIADLELDKPVVMTILRIVRDAATDTVLEVGTLTLAGGRQELIY